MFSDDEDAVRNSAPMIKSLIRGSSQTASHSLCNEMFAVLSALGVYWKRFKQI